MTKPKAPVCISHSVKNAFLFFFSESVLKQLRKENGKTMLISVAILVVIFCSITVSGSHDINTLSAIHNMSYTFWSAVIVWKPL